MNSVGFKLNIIHVACIIAVSQALLMAVFLFSSKKGNRRRNRILGFWFLSFAFLMGCSFLLSFGIWQYFKNHDKTIFAMSQISLLIGPLFYLYIKSLLDENFNFKKKDLIHLLPFIVIFCYIIGKIIFVKDFTIWRSFIDFFSNGFFLFQNLFYYFLIMRC